MYQNQTIQGPTKQEEYHDIKSFLDTVTFDNLVSFSYGSHYDKLDGETELMALERQKNGSACIKIEIIIKKNMEV